MNRSRCCITASCKIGDYAATRQSTALRGTSRRLALEIDPHVQEEDQ